MPSAYNSTTPTGVIHAFGGGVVPAGWLLCDGASYPVSSYPALASVFNAASTGGLAYAYGGVLNTSFNVPDLRGRFVRGSDNMGTGAATRDPGDNRATPMNTGGNTGVVVGSVQTAAFAAHAHTILGNVQFAPAAGTSGMLLDPLGTSHAAPNVAQNSQNIQSSGGNETRPLNANVNYIVKY